MTLYKTIDIDSLHTMQEELVKLGADGVSKKLRVWDVDYSDLQRDCPTVYQFIEERRHKDIQSCKFFYTPPNGKLDPHIDTLSNGGYIPIVVLFPVSGCNNTLMRWYDCPEDNILTGPFGFNKRLTTLPRDRKRMNVKEELTIDKITVAKIDIMHDVINPKDTPRVTFSIRFTGVNSQTLLSEAFELEDLNCNLADSVNGCGNTTDML